MHAPVLDGPGDQRQQLRAIHALELPEESPHAAGSMQRRDSDSDSSEQSQHQLNQIGHHHSPEPPGHGVSQHHQSHHRQQPQRVGHTEGRRASGDDAQRFHHLAQGQKGVTDADAVHGQGQQECLDPPQPGRSRTAVTKFGERRISEHATAAPQRRKHHGHGHVGQAKAPPLPVPSQSTAADQASDVEGGVDGKRRRSHGCTSKPAAETTACDEIVLLTTVATGQPQPQHKG